MHGEKQVLVIFKFRNIFILIIFVNFAIVVFVLVDVLLVVVVAYDDGKMSLSTLSFFPLFEPSFFFQEEEPSLVNGEKQVQIYFKF